MIEVRYQRWLLRADPDATRAAYAQITKGAPETCGCDPCLNFAAARDRTWVPAARALLDRLGIDYTREAEVYHLTPIGGGLHAYGGWFHFVGAIEAGDDSSVDDGAGGRRLELEAAGEHLSLGFTRRTALVPAPFIGQSIVQLEFTAEVPWIVDRPEPD